MYNSEFKVEWLRDPDYCRYPITQKKYEQHQKTIAVAKLALKAVWTTPSHTWTI